MTHDDALMGQTARATARPDDGLCQVEDIAPTEGECLRVARWEWTPEPDAHPVLLCNFHAEPLLPTVNYTDAAARFIREGDPMTSTVCYCGTEHEANVPCSQHHITGTICQGGVEHAVECYCGWVSPFTKREADAKALHAAHVEEQRP